jgi:hypothetical protein
MADDRSARKWGPIVVGALVLAFVVWAVWTWSNWGEPGRGMDDSPQAVMPPAGAAPGTAPTAEAFEPTAAAGKAQPDNSGRDATGDASRGDRTVEPETPQTAQERP